MQIDSGYTSGWYVSEDGAEIVSPPQMDDWADEGYVWTAEDYESDGSVDVTLPDWDCTVRYYPSTKEGLRLSALKSGGLLITERDADA